MVRMLIIKTVSQSGDTVFIINIQYFDSERVAYAHEGVDVA